MMQLINRTVRILDKAIDTAIIIFCALFLFISVYSILDNFWQVEGAMDTSILRYMPSLDEPMDNDAAVSENQIAWLCIDNTVIDYPVMQGEDNYEYLNKDPFGEFKLSGSIFLDYRNEKNLRDDYSLLYGHHMEHGAMFGALDAFRDKTYFDTHRSGRLVTEDTVYELMIFATSEANAADQTVFNPMNRTVDEILAFLEENAEIYEKPENGLRLLALSTCTGDGSDERWIVFAAIREK